MCDLPLRESTVGDHQRSLDLLIFFDEFVEFQGACAFFCDAVTGMLETNMEFDGSTLDGMRAYSDHVKQTAHELKGKLNVIREAGAK